MLWEIAGSDLMSKAGGAHTDLMMALYSFLAVALVQQMAVSFVLIGLREDVPGTRLVLQYCSLTNC